MRGNFTSTRERVASLVAITLLGLLAVVATAGGSVASVAGPAPGLCKMNVSRGKVPASFPIDGCVSGGGVFVRDTLGIPVGIDVIGDTGKPSTTGAPLNPIAALATLRTNHQPGLLIPGETVFVPVGSGAATVTVHNVTTAATTYVIADGFTSALPLGKGNAVVTLVSELSDVYLKYRNCVASAGAVTKVKCGALLTRDVLFAAGRAGITLAPNVASLAVAAIKQLKFIATLNSQLNKVSSGARTISLSTFGSLGGWRLPTASERLALHAVADRLVARFPDVCSYDGLPDRVSLTDPRYASIGLGCDAGGPRLLTRRSTTTSLDFKETTTFGSVYGAGYVELQGYVACVTGMLGQVEHEIDPNCRFVPYQVAPPGMAPGMAIHYQGEGAVDRTLHSWGDSRFLGSTRTASSSLWSTCSG